MTRKMHVYRIELCYRFRESGVFADRLQLIAAEAQGAVRKALSMSKPFHADKWQLVRIDITQLQ